MTTETTTTGTHRDDCNRFHPYGFPCNANETTTAYVTEPGHFIGPFDTEREALYYYGFAHGTHGQHGEAISLYTPSEVEYITSPDADAVDRSELVAPDADTLAQVTNLLALEAADLDRRKEQAWNDHRLPEFLREQNGS